MMEPDSERSEHIDIRKLIKASPPKDWQPDPKTIEWLASKFTNPCPKCMGMAKGKPDCDKIGCPDWREYHGQQQGYALGLEQGLPQGAWMVQRFVEHHVASTLTEREEFNKVSRLIRGQLLAKGIQERGK